MTPDSREAQAGIKQLIQKLEVGLARSVTADNGNYHAVSLTVTDVQQLLPLLADVLGSPRPEKECNHDFKDYVVCCKCGQTAAATGDCHHCGDPTSIRNGRCHWCLRPLTASAEVVSQPLTKPYCAACATYESGGRVFPMAEHTCKAEVVSQPPQEGWQPIETAPRDGTAVLLTGVGLCSGVYVGVWDDSPEYPDTWATGNCRSHESALTHWMPLPISPASAEGSIPSPTEPK